MHLFDVRAPYSAWVTFVVKAKTKSYSSSEEAQKR
ncbi:conserved hypothetical protein [Vibrio harveyi]|nr:conserved hypothetical protein [Vibrio harveyi]